MSSGIYSIAREGGRRYIGSAMDLKERWGQHRRSLRHGCHRNRHLQRAFDKYGESAFVFEVLEECEISQLIEREQWWIDCSLPAVYNISRTAGSSIGVVHTDESRLHMSESHKGKKLGPFTEEHRRRLSESNRGKHNLGAPLSEEHRRKIGEGGKGRRLTDEHRRHLSESAKGKPKTEEARRKMSEAHAGKTWSAARRAAWRPEGPK